MRAAALLILLAARAAAYDSVGTLPAHGATSLGPRAVFYKPLDADHGRWAPGAQLRLHLAPGYALEGSYDSVRYQSQGTGVRVTPIQATLLGYWYPESSLTPFLLIGGGWYPTRADAPYVRTQRSFGPHVGAGLELLGERWSVDGSYRFLWTQVNSLSDPKKALGRDFSRRGHMLTIGLNYRL